MPVVVVRETHESRDTSINDSGPSVVLNYQASGSTDDRVVYNAILENLPAKYFGLWLLDLKLTPMGGPHWKGSATYGIRQTGEREMPGQSGPNPSEEPPPGPGNPGGPDVTEPLGPEWSFDTVGGTRHIVQSLRTVDAFAPAGSIAPDYGGAIGVSKDRVEGCDVPDGKLELTTTRKFPSLSIKYIRDLSDLSPCVNSEAHWGFEAGELLFLGATGQYRSADAGGWVVTYRFAVARNEVNVQIGNDIVVTEKRGHHYIWVAYKDTVSEGVLTQQPLAAFVEQVLRERNFHDLKIG